MKKENSLIIREKENIFSRFFKWARNIFNKKEEKVWQEEPVVSQLPNITIPKAVQMSDTSEEKEELNENGLEYLYQLSEDELDNIDKRYNEQMEEAKNEILKLEDILQTYKQSIQKMQDDLANNEV